MIELIVSTGFQSSLQSHQSVIILLQKMIQYISIGLRGYPLPKIFDISK